ncbi:MAG TPA: hypothetical protein VLA88_01330 [Candidatus Saccharimonadales bacterium]|nr:hypothetical protein [Candidatus Saccharimonadales bacterium]
MKWAIYIGAGIGGMVGGYLPVLLWQADPLDMSSLLGGFIGTIVGLWVGIKLAQAFGD